MAEVSIASPRGELQFALSEAKRLGKRRTTRKLEEIGPPPYPAVFTERRCVTRIEGGMRPTALWKMGRAILSGHESSIFELPSGWRGLRWTMDAMWPEVSRLNLIEQVPALRLPVFFFLGRNDHFVPPQTSIAYFGALTAPSKQLLWFENSDYEPFVDEPDKFDTAMAELVRPLLPTGPRALFRGTQPVQQMLDAAKSSAPCRPSEARNYRLSIREATSRSQRITAASDVRTQAGFAFTKPEIDATPRRRSEAAHPTPA